MTGDETLDRETLAAGRAQGCDVDMYCPVPLSRVHEAAVLVTGVFSYQRTHFATKHNRHAIVEQSRKADAAICSLEPHYAPARRSSPASILITHNVANRALRPLAPNNMPATLALPAFVMAALLIGLAYGAIFAVLLFFAFQLCFGWLLYLRAARGLAIFLFFGKRMHRSDAWWDVTDATPSPAGRHARVRPPGDRTQHP